MAGGSGWMRWERGALLLGRQSLIEVRLLQIVRRGRTVEVLLMLME